VVICLEQGADLHMAQLMPLPLIISCFSEIQIGFTFLVPAHLGSPGKGPLNGSLSLIYNVSTKKRLSSAICRCSSLTNTHLHLRRSNLKQRLNGDKIHIFCTRRNFGAALIRSMLTPRQRNGFWPQSFARFVCGAMRPHVKLL